MFLVLNKEKGMIHRKSIANEIEARVGKIVGKDSFRKFYDSLKLITHTTKVVTVSIMIKPVIIDNPYLEVEYLISLISLQSLLPIKMPFHFVTRKLYF